MIVTIVHEDGYEKIKVSIFGFSGKMNTIQAIRKKQAPVSVTIVGAME